VKGVLACQANTKREEGLGGSGACRPFKGQSGLTRPRPKGLGSKSLEQAAPTAPWGI